MTWQDVIKESRFEKLKSVMMKYYIDENFDWLDGLEELGEKYIDGFIKHEIEKLKTKYVNEASKYTESANNLIRELEKI